MKGATAATKAIMLIGGLVVILLLVTSVFGRGIAFGILGIAAEVEPTFLQEEMRSFLTVAATSPGDFDILIPLGVNHRIKIFTENGISYIHVRPPRDGLGAFYSDPGRISFFDNGCTIIENDFEYNTKDNEAILIKRSGDIDDCELSIDVMVRT